MTCDLWPHGKTAAGYGITRREGRPVYVHRLAYEAAYGPIPDGLVIDHLCRNRACVNPEHLEAVTDAENTRRGLNAKLTLDQAQEIRSREATGESRRALAAEFGVTKSTVKHIVKGRTWRP